MGSFVDGSLAIIGIFGLPDSYYRYLIMYLVLLCLSFLISFNISGCDNNMSGFCRGRFGPWCHHILKLRRQKVLSSVSVLSHKCQGQCRVASSVLPPSSSSTCPHSRPYSQLASTKLTINKSFLVRRLPLSNPNTRNLGWIPTAIRGVLKLRYLLLGGAIGGGASIARQYEEWKRGLPDTDWIKEMVPDIDVDKFRSGLIEFKNGVKGKIGELQMDPKLKAAGWDTFSEFKDWFDKRLDKAIQMADEEEEEEKKRKELARAEREIIKVQIQDKFENTKRTLTGPSELLALSFASSNAEQELMKEKMDLIEKNSELIKTIEKLKEEKDVLLEKERKRIEADKQRHSNLTKKYDSIQEELMKSQIKYQKEIEKLEKENKELRKQLMLKAGHAMKATSIKKSLIDMYSDVLDELSGYDSSYNTADQLPRYCYLLLNLMNDTYHLVCCCKALDPVT